MTAFELLDRRFKESRDDILFLAADGRTLTYGQALATAKRIAFAWKEQGARKGDAIALVLMNDIGFPCSFLACMLGGFVAAPVNPELGAENVEFILDLVRPALVVDTPPAIEEGGSTSSDFDVVADLDACGAIFFTSGTTGRPKGVRHRWSALVGNVAAFNDAMALGSGTRMYHVLPMAYMAGFLNTVLSPMVAGGTVIIGPRFSASSALEFWTRPVRERANTIWVTPSIAAALTRLVRDRTAARVSATSFETVFCGTAPLHPSVRHQFNEVFGIKLQESYGTSELLLVSAQTRRQAERMTEDVGEPLPELALAFRRDAEGRDELIIRSPFAMIDYLTENGLETIADAEGFVPTGDMGRLDRGILQITGRIKDLIIRGGVNIVPRTVEDVVRDVAGVEDVAVVGMPHEFWGEALVVCIQVNPEAVAEQVEIAVRQRCRERLARSHQPDRIVMMPTFPRAATGKVQKHLVKRSLEE